MGPEGGAVAATRDANDWNPAWSPDGTRAAFQTYSGEDREIYVMNADGSDARNLTNNSGDDQTPDWSPDGTRIVFISGRDGNHEVYVMNADGSDQTRLTETEDDERRPRWSPDGGKIAYVAWLDGGANGEIFVMRADGTDTIQITDDPSTDNYPVWAPDGASLAFFSFRDGNGELYVAGADGSDPTNISNSAVDELEPEWSPDGSRLVFTSFVDAVSQSGSDKELFTSSADGTDRTQLTDNSTLDMNPRWSGYLPETVAWFTLTDEAETRGTAVGFDSLAADTVMFASTEDVAADSLVITEPIELTARRDSERLLRDIVASPAAGVATTWSITARVANGTESTATLGWRQDEIDALLAAAGDFDTALLTDAATQTTWSLSAANNPITLNTSASGVYKLELTIEQTTTTPVTYNLVAGWNLLSVPGPGDLTALHDASAGAFTWDAPNVRYATVGNVDEASIPHVDTGFWLPATAAGVHTVNLDLDSTDARAVSVTLSPGWNLIGAPADLPSPLPATAVDGGNPHNVLAFGDGQYWVASELTQGEGYWVLNSSDGDREASLAQMRHLSADGSESLFHAAPKLPEADWELRLSLDMPDGVTHGVRLGSSKYAREGYDALDIPQPPAPSARGFTAFYAEAEGVASRLTRSMVPVAKSDVEWTLTARMAAGGTLRWDGIELPQGYRMFLRREASAYALDRDGSMRLPKGNHTLTAYLAWQAPTATRALPNYPNPFNPETWIPFELSQASDVAIRIYDSRGMMVRRLELGYREEGYYTRRADAAYWDGRNEFGERVASGVYIYDVRAGSYSGLRRMVILK